ncbi:Putative S-adenosyl-L-methionine-dependent methyltransferase [Mycobacterium canetti]|nr:Putative S-adenosyl-L-methionine-dependent methyltransferase [Mycobacterium canetti]
MLADNGLPVPPSSPGKLPTAQGYYCTSIRCP